MKSVAEMGEDGLIERLLALCPPAHEDLVVGPGDDCAVIDFSRDEWQLLKTDAVVEGVHFAAEEDFRRVGWKAMARVVSDFAAMGGEGRQYLVTLGVPREMAVARLEDLYRGMLNCLGRFGGQLVGGETSRAAEGSGLWVAISAVGIAKKSRLQRRSTARVGDKILVTGRLGGSIVGKHLDIEPRVEQSLWLADQGFSTAMMDLSDGLAKDLPRLAKASGCGYRIDLSRVPCSAGCGPEQALNDGEDYELLFTVASDQVERLQREWAGRFPELMLTDIGEMVEFGESMNIIGGWDHFSSQS